MKFSRLYGGLLRAVWVLLFLSPAALSQSGGSEDASYSRSGADSCIACHDDAALMSVFRTPHGIPTDPDSPFGKGQLQCEACHGPGGQHAGRVRRGQERPSMPHFATGSTATVAENNAMCLECHGQSAPGSWHAGPHDMAEVACSDCHDVHVSSDPVLETATQPEVCFSCHTRQRSQALRPYAHPIADGKMDCAACHIPHGGPADSMLARQTVNATCFECHAEKRGPFLWEHAPVVEDCTNCHNPHGSNHPGMLSLRAPMLCQSCHSQAGHPSVALTDSGLVQGSGSALLIGQSCLNCHSQVHGSNHPSGAKLMR